MNATCEENQSKSAQFPCLMIGLSSGRVVLMTDTRTGVCVYNPNAHGNEVGYWSYEWFMGNFKPYDGAVTLQNN